MRQRHTHLLRRWALALPAAALVALLALSAASAGAVTAAGETTRITISAPSKAVVSGDKVNVDILVAPGAAIAGLQLDLRFDPQSFAVDSVTQGNLFTQDGATAFFNTGNIDNAAGAITGAFGAITSPGQSVSREGSFATVSLTAIADSPACPVVLSGIIVGDIEGAPVPAVVTNNGSLAAGSAPAFSWWVLGLIITAAVALIAAIAAGLVYRRRLLLKVPRRY